jgi:hypothetical protein
VLDAAVQTPTKLERCTLWSTLKFQRRYLLHITGYNVSRATKGITNVTMVSKATIISKAFVATL